MRYDIAMGDSFCSYEFPPFLDFLFWFVYLLASQSGILPRLWMAFYHILWRQEIKKLLAFAQFSRGTSVFSQPVMGVYSMWKSQSAIKDLKSSLMSIEMNNMPQMPLHVKYEASFWHLQMGQKWNEILAATLQSWKGTGWISDNNCSPEASR